MYKQTRFQLHVPDYIDTSKPLTEIEYRKAKADPNNKLHLPYLKDGEEYPNLVERQGIIRPNDDLFEDAFMDFMEIQIIRERDNWHSFLEIANKWNPYKNDLNPNNAIINQYSNNFLSGDGSLDNFAESVRMRDYWKYADVMLSWVQAQDGVKLKTQMQAAGNTFLDQDPSLAETIGDYVKSYLISIFWNKFTDWGIRPEEHIKNNLNRDPERWLSYGCPPHPEEKWGHWALFAAIGDGIRYHYDLPQPVNRELYEAEYLGSFFRILAGVHIPSSIKGHNEVLGREITY